VVEKPPFLLSFHFGIVITTLFHYIKKTIIKEKEYQERAGEYSAILPDTSI
jgi:hypothetical protein